MVKMGFLTQVISWVMLHVETINNFLIVNDNIVGSIKLCRGLRRGTLSFHTCLLFVLKYFMSLIRQVEARMI